MTGLKWEIKYRYIITLLYGLTHTGQTIMHTECKLIYHMPSCTKPIGCHCKLAESDKYVSTAYILEHSSALFYLWHMRSDAIECPNWLLTGHI